MAANGSAVAIGLPASLEFIRCDALRGKLKLKGTHVMYVKLYQRDGVAAAMHGTSSSLVSWLWNCLQLLTTVTVLQQVCPKKPAGTAALAALAQQRQTRTVESACMRSTAGALQFHDTVKVHWRLWLGMHTYRLAIVCQSRAVFRR